MEHSGGGERESLRQPVFLVLPQFRGASKRFCLCGQEVGCELRVVYWAEEKFNDSKQCPLHPFYVQAGDFF